MSVLEKAQPEERLTLEQKILAESDESACEYLLTSWFYRAMEDIRDARVRNGLTQQDIAERLGTTQSAIARLENAHEGNFSLKRFLEYAWASGAAPLDFAWVPPGQLRQYAMANPSAPRTYEAIRMKRLLDTIQKWGLAAKKEGFSIEASCRVRPPIDSLSLAESLAASRVPDRYVSTKNQVASEPPPSANSFLSRGTSSTSAAEGRRPSQTEAKREVVAA
jgi:transcriptional regulator with XRE-family HTH domain